MKNESLKIRKEAYDTIHDEFVDQMEYMPAIDSFYYLGENSNYRFKIGGIPNLNVIINTDPSQDHIIFDFSQPFIIENLTGKLIYSQIFYFDISVNTFSYEDWTNVFREFYTNILTFKYGVGGEILRNFGLGVIDLEKKYTIYSFIAEVNFNEDSVDLVLIVNRKNYSDLNKLVNYFDLAENKMPNGKEINPENLKIYSNSLESYLKN